MSDVEHDIWRTRFGDVAFGILWPEGSLSMPDFERESNYVTRHVAGSDRNITQLLGRGPKRVTHRLWLDTTADYADLDAVVQTSATLTVYASMTTEQDGYRDVHGEGMRFFSDVTLLGLSNKAVFPDGTVEVDALFQRDFS